VARDDRARGSSILDHERRAALARRTFALELDAAAAAAQRSTRKLVPVLCGLAAFGALLAVVAVVRLTRKPAAALVRITIAPAVPAPRSRFIDAILRAPLERGTLISLARLALQRLAARQQRSSQRLLPAVSSVAASSLADLERHRERDLGARGRGELRRP